MPINYNELIVKSALEKSQGNPTIAGYDYDGVWTDGYQDKNGIIITGRSYEDYPRIHAEMKKISNYAVPIYFNPAKTADTNQQNSGDWKAEMISKLGITDFWEDDPKQVEIIKLKTGCRVHLVPRK
jgi:hypothetical protein